MVRGGDGRDILDALSSVAVYRSTTRFGVGFLRPVSVGTDRIQLIKLVTNLLSIALQKLLAM